MLRRFIHDLFYIPKHSKDGPVSDKAFVANIALSVMLIVLCLGMLGLSAYAWFEGATVSNNSVVVSTTYDLDITVDGEEMADATLRHTGQAPADYEVCIAKRPDSTATTGFCIVRVDIGSDGTVDQTYHTVQIGKDAREGADFVREQLVLHLRLNQPATVTFEAHWGTSEHYQHPENNPLYLTETATAATDPLQIGQAPTPPSGNEGEQGGTSEGEGDAEQGTAGGENTTTATTTTTAGGEDTTTETTTTTETQE